MFWMSVGLLVAANLLYHICQKLIPISANPMVSVVVTFFVAGLVCLMLLPLFLPQGADLGDEFRKLNWTSALLGLTIIGIEVGFLLLYRSGFQISLGSIVVNAAVALALVPVGLVFFRERLLPGDVLGIGLLLAGLVLIARR